MADMKWSILIPILYLAKSVSVKGVTISDIRLNSFGTCNDTDAIYGAVEILVDGEWGGICGHANSYFWNKNASTVACRSLGYRFGHKIRKERFRSPGRNVHAFKCNGSESNLGQCSYINVRYCRRRRNSLSLICFNNTDVINSPRLMFNDKTNSRYGRAEVKICNKWGSIVFSQSHSPDKVADVLCRQLGYNFGGKAISGNALDKRHKQRLLWYIGLHCTGREKALSYCSTTDLDYFRYYHRDTAGVVCFKNTDRTIAGIRLLNNDTSHNNYGRVEIQIGGVWGTMFDSSQATTDNICRLLGFRYGGRSWKGIYGNGQLIQWHFDINCPEGEKDSNQCTTVDLARAKRFYSGRGDIGIVCFSQSELIIKGVRLTNQGKVNNSSGRVEVLVSDAWGSISNLNWDSNDTNVVCKSLGLRFGGVPIVRTDIFGSSQSPIWFNNFTCNGNEAGLEQCRKENISTSSRYQSAGVVCYKTGTENSTITSLRLVDRKGQVMRGSGEVELLYRGIWFSICHDIRWKKSNADIICKSLGFTKGGESTYAYNDQRHPVKFESIECDGNESHINECSLSSVLNNWSECTRDVYIKCRVKPVVHISSVNGRVSIRKGKELSLTCVVDHATPAVASSAFRWMKDGQVISGQNSSVYKVKRMEKSDEGNYGCAGVNEVGSSDWSSVQVNIAYLSSLTLNITVSRNGKNIPKVDLQNNDTVILTCSALSNPVALTSWSKYEETLSNFSSSNQYIIDKFTCLDNGVYSCHVTNEAMRDQQMSRSNTIVIRSVPEPPSHVSIVHTGPRKLCLVWEAKCSKAKAGGQDMFIVQSSTDDKTWRNSSPISTEFYCVENLHPDTLYYVRVVARNRYGDSQAVYSLNGGKESVQTSMIYELANVGMMVGILLAVIIAIAVSVILAMYIYQKRKNRKPEEEYACAGIDVRGEGVQLYQELDTNLMNKPEDAVKDGSDAGDHVADADTGGRDVDSTNLYENANVQK